MCIFQTSPFSTASHEKLHIMQVAVLKNLHTVSISLILRKISVSAPNNCTVHTPPCKFGFDSSIVFQAEKMVPSSAFATSLQIQQLLVQAFWGWGILALILLSLTPRISQIKPIFSDISYCYSNVRTRALCALMPMNYSASAAWLEQWAEVRARSLTWTQMKKHNFHGQSPFKSHTSPCL